MSTFLRSLVAAASTTSLVLGATVLSVSVAAADEVDATPGTVVKVEELAADLWLPGTAEAKRITYWTVGSDGNPALSTGAFFVPEGQAPEGGWPVVGWAHGTSGLDDDCAPSLVGPA
ncbi:MAG: lipase, partial [Rhodococcus sp. (in: high G+C Gram-positive bacteria)]